MKRTYELLRFKRKIAFMLAFILIITSAFTFGGVGIKSVKAEDKKSGCVLAGTTGVRIRTSPNTGDSSNIITSVDGGTALDILGEEFTSNNYSWYKVGFYHNGTYKEGYIASMYVTVYSEVDYSSYDDFVSYLRDEGFPESYYPGLVALHDKYPNWVFKADKTGLNWNYVVEQENVAGRSLVPYYFKSSAKSTAYGCYDWETGEYTEWDSGGWVQASSAIVEYYLDPRNYFDEKHIFAFEDLSYNGAIQKESGLTMVVNGTFLDKARSDLSYGGVTYPTYVSALMAAGVMSGVSPYHLATRMIQEMGRDGNSDSISGTRSGYEGYYNYYNWGAYKSGSISAIENGLIYAKKEDPETLRPWSSRMLAIIGGAKKLGKGYINAGQNTAYYEKFDMTNFCHQYMTNISAAYSEGATAYNAYSDSVRKNTALCFTIPVFNNMPSSNVPFPEGDGSPNNKLKTLGIDGYSLTPTFNADTLDYSIIMPNTVSGINIKAEANDSKASVSGAGNKALNVGSNDFEIKVVAENGDLRVYNIRAVRDAVSQNSEAGSFTSNYAVDDSNKCISSIGVGTNGVDFVKGLTFSNGGRGKVVKADGQEQKERIATGNKLITYDSAGNKTSEYNLVVYGDINGDGDIDILDIVKLKKHILDAGGLEGANIIAADANHDGNVGILDIVAIKRHILGMGYITQ